MTICNMSIEGGARVGYVNPDETTFALLSRAGRSRRRARRSSARVAWWKSMRVRRGRALRRSRARSTRAEIEPTVTWGINPGQSVACRSAFRRRSDVPAASAGIEEALAFMGFDARRADRRHADRRRVRRLVHQRRACPICAKRRAIVRGHRVAPHVKALVVPGSQAVRAAAEREGLHEIFTAAGFEWRGAGCSMCLAMNPDRLEGRQVCASSSNRNFKGRQGSPTGRTLLMSPAMVAAAALAGEVVDVRTLLDRDLAATR